MAAAGYYEARPVHVEAFQFKARFSTDAYDLIQWIYPRRAMVYYVPQGYEHYMRKDGERDHSRSDVLEDAPAFLVFRKDGEDQLRIDDGNWVVSVDNDLRVLTDKEFHRLYQDRTPDPF